VGVCAFPPSPCILQLCYLFPLDCEVGSHQAHGFIELAVVLLL
jgi:hypothetical protein